MIELAHVQPHDNLHVVDLPYRLSSWALDHPENGAFWHDETGRLMAWAVIQLPFWCIDYVIHPTAPPDVARAVLAWADMRAGELRQPPAERAVWFVNVFDRQAERRTELEAWGFADQSNVPENPWSKVLLTRPVDTPLPTGVLPSGFVLRPLSGAAEVDAYVELHQAVFESKSMTSAWRQRTLRQPQYRPELDLVIVDPDGQLAAFCIGWLAYDEAHSQSIGQIEPIGVRADMRRHGLGRVILAEAISRLSQLGAAQILVETDNYRDAAFALYTTMGFHVRENVLVYRKDYPSA
jgi:ribosomal protein S18 acetylase RimI-like enzyme